MTRYQRELEVAFRAALLAGERARSLRQAGLRVEDKEDLSPVTAADRAAEEVLVQALLETFPRDGLLSEEGATETSRSGRRWILDPIDGTREFIRGSRMWAIFVALEDEGEVRLGLCHFPAWEETYWAVAGQGAWCNDEPIHVSAIRELSRAVLCVNELQRAHQCPFGRRLIEWMGRFWAVRSTGGCPDAMSVAAGRADVWIDPSAKPWDLAPIKIITEEAGGCFRNFDGGSSIYGGNCFTCTPALEQAVFEFLHAGETSD